MATTLEAIDFQLDGIAWFAFDIHLRSGAGCSTWPALAWFVPRLLAGCAPGTIDFIGRLAFECVVRTMVVASCSYRDWTSGIVASRRMSLNVR